MPQFDDDAAMRHLPTLQGYVRRRMGATLASRESCDDIVQSVCRELVAQGDCVQFDSDEAMRHWLQTAAMHKIMQKARHYRTQRRAVDREVADAHSSQVVVDGQVTPSRDASAREQVRRFEAALARLSAEDREVITMIKIAGLTHQEAAARTGRSVEASRTQLRRALIRLSELMTTD